MRRRLAAIALLGLLGFTLSACVVYPDGGDGYCYRHPRRC